MDIHASLTARQNRRMAAESRFLAQIERREATAGKMIGELVRDGQPVFYVWPRGGKYHEGQRAGLIAFLIRNNYA